ncbi:uncharacterized protein LOC128224899 [Mya arenaria]|uniref:uncharacterized protein LOC128224899 n=1 Tax=Mya arenaria TaxID=6604 RepID=UPI0022E1597C|nr:uncharacterized protein LOC128224899 [Mya arenaria]
MGIGYVVIALSFVGICHGLDMSRLQPYNFTAEIMFIVEDLDQDGIMTVAEIDTVFAQYDTNGDGKESRHEYTAFICAADPALYQISHYLYDAYDVNGDHKLDLVDYEGFHNNMDSNNDGLLNMEEFVAYWVALLTSIESVGNHQHGQSHEHGAPACHT